MAALPLVDALDAALPQTQCTRCGYPDCRGYAQAIADGAADINRCPPGGAQGVERLAALAGRPVRPLDGDCGVEAPRTRAVIDEAGCIGCTLCIKACPVDCIVGASKRMHTVIADQCTGCELCLPACPVDCIVLVDASNGRTGWDAWSAPQADAARARYLARGQRLAGAQRAEHERLGEHAHARADADPAAPERKRAWLDAALARARHRRGG